MMGVMKSFNLALFSLYDCINLKIKDLSNNTGEHGKMEVLYNIS